MNVEGVGEADGNFRISSITFRILHKTVIWDI